MKVIIIESQMLYGTSIKMYLQRTPFITAVDLVTSASAAMQCMDKNNYQLALIRQELLADFNLQISENQNFAEMSMTKIVIARQTSSARIRKAFLAGAKGYITNESTTQDLITAIEETTRGKLYCSPDVNHYLLQEWLGIRSNRKLINQVLSNRELEVLSWYAKGIHAKEISDILSISPSTVAVHKHNIFQKLGLASPADLVAFCHDNDDIVHATVGPLDHANGTAL